jgi:hypothetical protein
MKRKSKPVNWVRVWLSVLISTVTGILAVIILDQVLAVLRSLGLL